MLNFIGMVVTAALMMVIAKALIAVMDVSPGAKKPVGGPKMGRPFICLLAALLFGTALVTSHEALAAGESASSSSAASHHPDLNYLKAVNSVAPPKDPELLFLLMAEYSSANLQGEGAEFFSTRL